MDGEGEGDGAGEEGEHPGEDAEDGVEAVGECWDDPEVYVDEVSVGRPSGGLWVGQVAEGPARGVLDELFQFGDVVPWEDDMDRLV